jgi:hypothetical protein
VAGYSGTPLPKKLGIKDDSRVLVRDAPDGFLPGIDRVHDGPADVIVAFHTARAELENEMPKLREQMVPAARLWIAWPKKAAKMDTDLTENVVREIALANKLVDNKVAAIDETWSGLQLVIRLKDR